MSSTTYAPGPTPDTVKTAEGKVLHPPEGWTLLPPGDAALTRRVKAQGDFWLVQEKKGRKVFSRGVWAKAELIESLKKDLEAERDTDAYKKKREADTRRREKKQEEYVEDFEGAVSTYLNFHPRYETLAKELSKRVTELATPVGSGTVARTQRIPIEKRAEAAVIAWLRHQTTGYDNMVIPRVKGKRREVRRMLARRSKELLDRYRQGKAPSENCPLQTALKAFYVDG